MPDETEPEGKETAGEGAEGKAPGAEGAKDKAWYDGPGSKPGSRNNSGSSGVKQDYGKKEKTWGNEKEEEGGEGGGKEGGKEGGKLEKEIGIGPVYKKTFIDTEEDEEHQKKYSNKKGEHDLNFVSALNAKVSAEVLSASYDPDKKIAKATLLSAKAEFVAVHAQVGLKVDVGKAIGDKIKDLLFDKVEVPGPNPPSPPAPMAARVGDLTAHLAPLAPGPGSPNVLIGGMPAWRIGLDIHVCPAPGAPHGPGPTSPGAITVLINGAPAARASDFVVEPTGGPDVITLGCPTVLIGPATPPPAGGPAKPKRGFWGSLVEDGLDMLSGLVLFESVASGELGKAEAEVKADAEIGPKGGKIQAHAGVMAAVLKGEIPIKIRVRIPYTKQFLGIGVTGEGTLLSAGAEAGGGVKINEGGKAFEMTGGAKAGVGVGGLGVKGTVDVAEAGDDYPHLSEKGPEGSEASKAPAAEGGGKAESGGAKGEE